MAIDAFDGSFTYEELDRCSDRIAHYLVSMEVGPESMVALCFEKSRWAIVALIGVIKAGGASVFIDPSNPRSRREEILKQLPNTEFVLTDSHHEKSWRQMGIRPIVICDELVKGLREFGITPRTGVCPDNLLYIIFTSGSTGIPKACQITHSAFLSGALQHAAKSNLGPRSRVLQLASYSFDVSVLEILTSLISGACVCTPGNDAMVKGLADVINQYQITWSFLTPSLVSLIKPDEVPTLKTLILGGELLHKAAIQIWAPRLQLVNGKE
jgi:non-ribosomal peptide synthetase component F